MHVRVLEPGKEHLPPEVHDLGRRPDVLADLGVGSQGNDAATADGDRLGPPACRVDRIHRAGDEDEVGRSTGIGAHRRLLTGSRDEMRAEHNEAARAPRRRFGHGRSIAYTMSAWPYAGWTVSRSTCSPSFSATRREAKLSGWM